MKKEDKKIPLLTFFEIEDYILEEGLEKMREKKPDLKPYGDDLL